MPRYTPTQLAELRELSTGMLDHIRILLRNEQADPARFITMMTRLQQGYDLQGAAFVIRAWLDTLIDACPHAERGTIQGVAFTNSDDPGFDDPDQLSAEYRWAAAAVAARMADNQVRLYQLIDAIPRDRVDAHLLRVAAVVAETLNEYDRPTPGDGIRPGDVVLVRLADSHN